MPLGGLGTASLIGGGLKAASSIFSLIKGIGQSKRANRMAKDNIRPTYQIPNEVLQNQQIAQLFSNQGMPSQQYQQAKTNIQENQAAALSASSDRRGGLGNIGAVLQGTNRAQGNLDAQSAQMRMQNIGNLMNQNQILSNYRDTAFKINQMQPYQENAAAIRALSTAGQANAQQGITGIADAAGTFLSGIGGNLTKGMGATNGIKPGAMESFMSSRPTIDTSLIPSAPMATPWNSPGLSIYTPSGIPDGAMEKFMSSREQINPYLINLGN